jgi:hypothetical protein
MSSLRRMILVAAAVTTALSANLLASDCATCKGSWKAGGGMFVTLRTGEYYESGDGFTNWSMSVTPNAEKFFGDGTSFGGEFIFTRDYEGTKRLNFTYTAMGLMPFISHYVALGGKARTESSSFFFVKFGPGYLKNWYRGKYTFFDGEYTSTSSWHSWFIGGQIGVMPMLSKSVGLEVGALAIHQFLKAGGETVDGTVFQFGAGITVFAM